MSQQSRVGPACRSAKQLRRLQGTLIYTIGYDLDAGTGAPEQCQKPEPDTGHQDNSQGLETGCGLPPSGWGSPSGMHLRTTR